MHFDELIRKIQQDGPRSKLQANIENSGGIVAFLLRATLACFWKNWMTKNYKKSVYAEMIGESIRENNPNLISQLVFATFKFKVKFLKYLKV